MMQLKTRTWCLISICCFLGAAYFWRLGDQYAARSSGRTGATTPAPGSPGAVPASPASGTIGTDAGKPKPNPNSPAQPGSTNSAVAPALPYRLSNTTSSVDQLSRSDHGILLMNASIDTSVPVNLPLPPHLRAGDDPGAYIVQARGPIDDNFRAQLREAGVTIVSYIPQNAYLVRASAAAAARLAALPATVLPWEPYYKLAPDLLPAAIEQSPVDSRLNVLVFPGDRDTARQTFTRMDITILAEQRSPFGTQFVVQPPADALVPLAQLPSVQMIEKFYERISANDLMRPRLGVATNSITTENYLGLTGRGVRVNVNDTGVAEDQPHLMGRVTGDQASTLVDADGHGTHVAGTIAGDTTIDSDDPAGETVPGSETNATYRGIAPEAEIFALPINSGFDLIITDQYLQETAATNVSHISNNSWAYGNFNYDISAASWDAAVRDALPEVTGSQPLLFVFVAGNDGGGDGVGFGGSSGRINSPGTAKNVITVGSIEQLRNLTNEIVIQSRTNMEFLANSDSTNQVAGFSGRGNVGVAVEGNFGRFKPDLVAPGTWVVSTRSRLWTDPGGSRSSFVRVDENRFLRPGQTNTVVRYVPPEGIEITVRLRTNIFSGPTLPILPIYARPDDFPDANDFKGTNNVTFPVTVTDADWFISVVNTNKTDAFYDLITIVTVTNDPGNRFVELKKLNDLLAPHYRFDSGTSMSAAGVSGMLALMQQHFADTLGLTNPSPALFKALLINGARTVSGGYDFQVRTPVNHQGWGLPNLTNSLPLSLTQDSIQFFDQDSTNALATGQEQTRIITLNSNSQNAPLRVTLVWTDPPGNPGAGIKLVNDLDLVVSNLTTGTNVIGGVVFTGNQFGGLFSDPASTNGFLLTDNINNVENVYLLPPLGDKYSITVRARRVNVNAVTAHPNNVVQDYALVISHGTNEVSTTPELPVTDPKSFVTTVTNGLPLLNQRVAANTPLIGTTNGLGNGVTNQWNFYVFSNVPTVNTSNPANPVGGPNVAFVTFLPPNLSRSRLIEGDLDMYVSKDMNLTNLDAAVIANAMRSRKRGGTESVIITNAAASDTFYVGIKSEDQQAVSYGFFAISTFSPFSERDSEGNLILHGFPVGVDIPDGSAVEPMAGLMFAFAIEEITVNNVLVTNIITHDQGGDLLGNLSHDNRFAVLNNHRGFTDTVTFIWDDSDSGEIPESEPVDGPGSLRDFVGEQGVGTWQLTMIDNAPSHTGRVDQLTIRLEPQPETNGAPITVTILPNRFFFTSVDVPADATNLSVCVSYPGAAAPVEVYIRRNLFPDRNNFDTFAIIDGPGDCLNLGKGDSPPLSQGRYFIGVFNPNAAAVTVTLRIFVQRDLEARTAVRFRAGEVMPLLDDALTNAVLFVTNQNVIADLNVGVRIDHERLSDLVLHLVSPLGTRVLLAENRGGTVATNFGVSAIATNVFPTSSTGSAAPQTNIFDVVQTVGTVQITYDFFQVPDQMRIYYDGSLIYDTGLIPGSGTFTVDYGPGSATNIVITMNEMTNANSSTLWEYTATIISGRHLYATFTDNTNLTTLPIKFAPPPFAPTNVSPTNIVILRSGFETNLPGIYSSNQVVDGWTITNNQVTVINGGTNADSGSQFLALGDGHLAQFIPTTVAGRRYRLRFANQSECIVGWWPGEGDATDVVGGNNGFLTPIPPAFSFSTNGVVDRDFDFSNQVSRVLIPAAPALNVGLSDGFTVECWIKPRTLLRRQALVEWNADNQTNNQPIGTHFWISFLNTGDLYADLVDTNGVDHIIASPGLRIDTNYQHVALTYDKKTREARLYRNGVIIASTNFGSSFVPQTSFPLNFGWRPLGPFANSPYSGRMDEISIYQCVLSEAEIRGIHRAGSLGKSNGNPAEYPPSARLLIDGATTDIISGPGWRNQSVTFFPASNGTTLELEGNALPVLFDSFELIEDLSDIFYLPEEPLSAFKGEQAYGEWRLEVWDTRAGGALTNAQLISWELQFTFVNTNPPTITLTNRTCYADKVEGSNTLYFVVNVPRTATFATNSVFASDQMDLVFNTNSLPFTNAVGNVLLLDDTTNGAVAISTNINFTVRLDTNGVPLPPPQPRAFMTQGKRYYMALRNTDQTKTNDFSLCLNFSTVPPAPLLLRQLTNRIVFTNTIASSNLLDFYQFNVSSNAVAVLFDILNPNGNVDLFVRHGLPLPNPTSFDFRSINAGTNAENITRYDPTLTTLSGSWYLAVQNRETFPVTYEIRATEVLAVKLKDAVPYFNVISTVPVSGIWSNAVDYYRYTVSSNAFGADFEVRNTSGNVDLYIKRIIPPLPSPVSNLYRSENPGAINEFIRVTNTTRINPLTPGDWWLGVVNKDIGPVAYTVIVTEDTNRPISIISLTNRVPYTNMVGSLGVDYYVFTVSPNAVQANFEILNPNGNVDLFVRPGLPLPDTNTFDFAGTNGGLSNEFVPVTLASPVALAPGDWYLAVVNQETNPVTYIARVSEFVPGTTNLVTLTNGVLYTNRALTRSFAAEGIDYYVFDVPTNAVEAHFEVFNLSGNVDLFIRPGLPLPGPTNFTYASTRPATFDEFIAVSTASTPPLTPGPWYLGVVNNEAVPVTYTVRVTAFAEGAGLTRLTNGIAVTNRVGFPSPPLNPGVDYYVFNISTNAVQAKFEVFGAISNVDLYIRRGLPLPNPTNFHAFSANGGPTNELILLTTNSIPVPLGPGDWYLTVVNRDPLPVDYTIRATEFAIGTAITVLTNGIGFSNCVAAAGDFLLGDRAYYLFKVSSNALQVSFETFQVAVSNDVDLFVRRGVPLPDSLSFDYASTNAGTGDEQIIIATNSVPVALSPGDWYLTVQNRNTNAASCYFIRATEAANVVTLTNALAFRRTVPGATAPFSAPTDYYRFVVSSNAIQVAFEALPANGNVDLFIRPGLPAPTSKFFTYASTNGGNTNEVITLTTNSPPLLLQTGEWYLAVVNRSTNAVTYSVRATELLPGREIIILTNGVPFTTNIAGTNATQPTPSQSYVYTVTTNAVRAQFEIIDPTGNVDLYARKGLPVPSPLGFDLLSTNGGISDELIILFTNGIPVALTPGDWYLTVVNTSGGTHQYTVKATEFTTTGTPFMIIRWEFTNSMLCLTWNSLAGVNYYVQGRTNLTTALWEPVSPTITATNSTASYCMPLPTPYSYFRVVEGLSPLSAVLVLNFSASRMTPGGFVLRWNAPTNQQFTVHWSPAIPTNAWNSFNTVVTSTNGLFTFIDDGTMTGCRGINRFYRINLRP